MEITTTLLQLTDKFCVCAAIIRSDVNSVNVYASALAGEDAHYIDLAQSRALSLAHQLFEQGPEGLRAQEIIPNHPTPVQIAQNIQKSGMESQPTWIPPSQQTSEAVIKLMVDQSNNESPVTPQESNNLDAHPESTPEDGGPVPYTSW